MASEAHPKTLRDYFTLQRGTTYKSRLLEQPGPVLLGLATIQRNGGFRSDSLRTYGGDSPENLLVQPGELYASLKDVTQSADLLGAVAKLPIGHAPGRLTQDTVKLEPKFENVPIDYIYWLLRTPQYRTYCRAHATGTTNLGLPRDDFLAYPVPELTTARSCIVDTLTALDDKIELNRQMNETFEEMARTLFKSWFVDFDPVHAKAALRNHTANHSPLDWTVERARAYLDGMDPSIAALFPDSFVDSELGEVPEGWRVEQFGDHISATRGLSYKGAGLCGDDEGLPMHNLNSIFEGGGYKYNGIKYYKGEYREKHLLKSGDLIVTNTEQGFDRLLIGYAAIVPENFGQVGLYSHHIYRINIKSKSVLTPHYLVHLFNSPFYHHWISGFANGTTINMLPMDALEIPLLVVPPSELIRAFAILAQNIHAQFQSNLGSSHTLTALRDTLLPRLISGELRVGASRRFLESVS